MLKAVQIDRFIDHQQVVTPRLWFIISYNTHNFWTSLRTIIGKVSCDLDLPPKIINNQTFLA